MLLNQVVGTRTRCAPLPVVSLTAAALPGTGCIAVRGEKVYSLHLFSHYRLTKLAYSKHNVISPFFIELVTSVFINLMLEDSTTGLDP